ncbi:type I methionyl aminopeptidase [Thermovenabulum sp.]|uniref:type I methionyl aminopeptidase n=1 Tax=Thermovenabulum sp. TaxID=3100335 RepID=UPI003C7EB5F0
MIIIKSKREIDLMKKAGKVVAKVLEEIKKAIKPGIATIELDRIAEDIIKKYNAIPAFKGYRGYPATICSSINEEVVHGIPGLRFLKDGDIISIDVGAVVDGYCADAARTYPVGEISETAKKLIMVTEYSFFEGIKYATPDYRLSDISHAIQSYVESNNFSVVRDYVGHGIGRKMHEEPQVPNFGPPGKGPRLREGMTLAIEPMVNVGGYEVETLIDGWTVVTKDRSLSAHYENTIAITDGEPEILTLG